MGTTVAEDLAAALRRHGVRDVFGQSLPSLFFLATPGQSIRQVVYRTENAGGAMADGYARVSGRVGVVAAQNGPAATLLVPPLAEALKASVPVIAIVQEVARPNRDRNALSAGESHGKSNGSDPPSTWHRAANRDHRLPQQQWPVPHPKHLPSARG